MFFGGARGGGKTDGMLGEFTKHAGRYGKHAIGLMIRRTRTELIETIERSRAIYTPLGWKYNETDKMWRAPNEARLRLPTSNEMQMPISIRGTPTRGSMSRRSALSRRRLRFSS